MPSTSPKKAGVAAKASQGRRGSCASMGCAVFFVVLLLAIFVGVALFVTPSDDKPAIVNQGIVIAKSLGEKFIAPILRFVLVWLDGQRLPNYSETLHLRGLRQPVRVYWDEVGAPHIYAKNRHDLLFTSGYLHAQDRLFQMDLSRHVANGQLSSLMGEATLRSDRLLRILGFYRRGIADNDASTADIKLIHEAYLEGLNHYIDTSEGKLPIEYTLLGFKPRRWSSEDLCAFERFMSWNLAAGDQTELAREALYSILKEDLAKQFEIPSRDKHTVLGTEFNPNFAAHKMHVEIDKVLGPYIADGISNAWAVHGSLTESGKPILANDPHLRLRAPSIWYQMHLVSESDTEPFEAMGVSIPGLPGIAIGRNPWISWGCVVSMVDTKDLFLEKFVGEEYEFKGKMVKPTISNEIISVKGRGDVEERVWETIHGPVVSRLFNSNHTDDVHHEYALRSIALDTTPASLLRGFYSLNLARNWNEFIDAMKLVDTVSLDFLYADVHGNIGYYVSGNLPMRNPGEGLLPRKGWTGEEEWKGYIPFDEKPFSLNPKSGFVVAANNKIVGDDYKHYLGNIWATDNRARRITQLLNEHKATGKFTLETMVDIQNDVVDTLALEWNEKFLAHFDISEAELDETERAALNVMKSWKGEMKIDQVGGTLYHAISHEFVVKILETRLNSTMVLRLLGITEAELTIFSEYISHATVNSMKLLDNPESGWWLGTSGKLALMKAAFKKGISFLRTRLGDDVSSWKWGKVHRVTWDHSLAAAKKFYLNLIFSVGPYPVPGSNNSPAAAAIYRTHDNEFFDLNGPGVSYKHVVDMADVDKAVWIQSPGQSGRVSSPYYMDQVDKWLSGDVYDMLMSKSKVIQAAKASQTLVQSE